MARPGSEKAEASAPARRMKSIVGILKSSLHKPIKIKAACHFLSLLLNCLAERNWQPNLLKLSYSIYSLLLHSHVAINHQNIARYEYVAALKINK